MTRLYHPRTLAYMANVLEGAQAERDLSEAYAAWRDAGFPMGGPEDYAYWNAGAYAATCERLIRDTPVWQ